MKVGIIADTHDNLKAVRYLVEFFNNSGVEVLLHAGDFISPFVIPELASFEGRVIGVFGNNDGDRETLAEFSEKHDLDLCAGPRRFEIGDRTFLMAHRAEDLPQDIPAEIDVVISGHTHRPVNEKRSGYLKINPGEAGGWLTCTIHSLLLDLDDLKTEIFIVHKEKYQEYFESLCHKKKLKLHY